MAYHIERTQGVLRLAVNESRPSGRGLGTSRSTCPVGTENKITDWRKPRSEERDAAE